MPDYKQIAHRHPDPEHFPEHSITDAINLGDKFCTQTHSNRSLLSRVFATRGVYSAEELDTGLKGLLPPTDLKDISKAAGLLADAITAKQSILIVGDYDADGATACALCMLALRKLGAGQVDYLVPNRFEFGYGLTPEIVEIAKTKKPDWIMTVDNGVASHSGIDAAHAAGIGVIVTDHHLAADTLPNADALVNPNQPGDVFASKALAGVGVAFYVMLATRSELKQRGLLDEKTLPNLAELLDLVALGTVADLVPLDRNNRILVAQGIARIQNKKCRPGIIALLKVAGREPEKIVSSDLGFCVAPRINAAGRLDDISVGIECLLTNDESVATELAESLNSINVERRVIQQEMQNQAMQAVALVENLNDATSGLCLFNEEWHHGVVGLVASRIKDETDLPVIALAPDDKNNVRGSARSIKGLHIRDLLDRIDKRNPGLITRFGGHAMAAGLTLPRDNYAAFKNAFEAECETALQFCDGRGILLSDGEPHGDAYSLDFAALLKTAAPWGQAFPEPLFDSEMKVIDQRVVGERHLKMTVLPQGARNPISAIAFGSVRPEAGQPAKMDTIHAAFRLDVNEFRGDQTVQLVIEYFRPIN